MSRGVPKSADVIIIGAGIAGLSTARALTEGAKLNVIVIDMEPSYGCGATTKAAGAVRRQVHKKTLAEIAHHSTLDMLTYEQRYGISIECEQPGYLNLTNTINQQDKLLKENRFHREVGIKTKILSAQEIKKRWGFINCDDILIGIYSPEDLNVDPYQVATALYKGARRGGAKFIFGKKVTAIMRKKNGGITGVRLNGDQITTPVIVNAAGPWATEVCKYAGMHPPPPLLPRRRQIWIVAKLNSVPQQIPFIVDLDAPFYIRPYRETFLLSLMEEDEVKLISNQPPFEWSWIFKIGHIVGRRIPEIENASVAKGWAGWRTLTPDDCPIIGKVDELPGFYLLAGLGGHGLALGPFSGQIVASQILGSKKHEKYLKEYSYKRFSNSKYQ